MKVITEERLREIQSSISDGRSKLFMKLLINECKEIDTLTVSKLRPMCDAPVNEPILIFDGVSFCMTKVRQNTKLTNNFSSDIDGWIPMPTYKPE